MASAFGAFDVLRGERGFVRSDEAFRESRRGKRRHREKTRRATDVRGVRLPGRVVRRVSDGTRRCTMLRVVTRFGTSVFVNRLTPNFRHVLVFARVSRRHTGCRTARRVAALVAPTSASPSGCHAPRRARRFPIARRRASSRGTDAACVSLGTRPIGSPDPRRFASASVARRP